MDPSEEAAPTEAPVETLSNEQLVRNQVEYYLSSKNLASDTYLVSKMDSNMWVPVEVICSFKMIQSLIGTDQEALLACIKDSTSVVLDAENRRIRPHFKNERNTVMLREIPESTEQSQISSLFAEHEKNIVNIRPEIGDNWYVNFEDDPQAMAALEHLQFGGVCFNGASVRARIKSENLVRSFIASQQAANTTTQGLTEISGPSSAGFYSAPPMNDYRGGYQGQQPRFGGWNQAGWDGTQSYGAAHEAGAPTKGKGRGNNKTKKKGKGLKGPPNPLETAAHPSVQLGPQDFPPLPPSPATGGPHSAGYANQSFQAYDVDTIAQIVQTSGAARPETIPPECAVGVMIVWG